MKINELETHLYKMILENWGNIDTIAIFLNDENVHFRLEISDCEGEFWCDKESIAKALFIHTQKNALNLGDFFSDKWGISLKKKAETITIK